MARTIDLTGVRCLVVDDDPNLRRILARTLAEWGADVVSVENGPRGIVEMKTARDEGKAFALVLLDVTMSGVNGFEVAERIREDHPEELATMILMLGSNPDRHELERIQSLGLGGYLSKPIDRPSLVGTMATALRSPVGSGDRVAQHPPRTRILVAEDSADALNVIAHYLGGSDFQVDTAENGSIAVDLFRLAEYDLVLMDIQMPVYDGYRAMQIIRAWEKEHAFPRTPVVAVTAYAETEDALKCLRAGFDGYLTKPLRRDLLLATVRRHTTSAARASG